MFHRSNNLLIAILEKKSIKIFIHSCTEPGKPLPHVSDLYRNISLFLVNVHKSIAKPRPQMPGIIHYGGAHIKQPKSLPSHLQNYLDNSENGVILFSLGSYLNSSELPREKIDAFTNVFGKIKQNVIWKFEDESFKVPSNVLIKKWLPQTDILAHPNVILFIAHGGNATILFTNLNTKSN